MAILGNVALWAGEKLEYNDGRNHLDKHQYDRLLTRQYRPDYPLPQI